MAFVLRRSDVSNGALVEELDLAGDELRIYLTDTLGNSYVKDEQLAATYRPIALS
jgi:hypothetical protein